MLWKRVNKSMRKRRAAKFNKVKVSQGGATLTYENIYSAIESMQQSLAKGNIARIDDLIFDSYVYPKTYNKHKKVVTFD